MNTLTQRLRADVQGMHAYAVQDSTGMLKLDAMENTHRLPAALQRELGERLGAVAINRYPGARIDDLKAALAKYIALPAGHSLSLGNGSDECISLLAMAVTPPDASAPRPTILAPVPGFVMYAMSAQFQALPFVGVPLLPDFELDVPAMLAAIAQHKPAVTYLACPNNPTANLWRAEDVDAVIAACKAINGICVIDEAYQPFASHSYADRAQRNEHVIVMRTLSKFGLAGIRLGYMFGPKAIVDQVDKLRPPYNVSVLNAEAALFALENECVYAEQAESIRIEREKLLTVFAQLPNCTVFKSQANMILLRVRDADDAFANLKARNVLVKNVSRMHALLANCLRVSVGTPEENQTLLAALKASV
jgi:histidinol-phosphate aminotransferase